MPFFLSKEEYIGFLPYKSIILLLKNSKIYGVFQKPDILNNKLVRIENFRRGIEIDFFYKNFNKQYVKLSSRKFEKIYRKLYEKNNPQLSADILFIKQNKNKISFKYIENYRNILIQNYTTIINKIYLENLIKEINSFNLQNHLKKLGVKIYKLFFRQNFIFNDENRFIYFIIDKKLRHIPFELAFDGNNFLYEKHIIGRGYENIFHPNYKFQIANDFSVCIPIYSEKNYFGKEFNDVKLSKIWSSLIVYKKKFTRNSIIKIIAKSKIFYFSGHINYDSRKEDFKILLNDSDFLYLSELKNLPEMPDLIVLNACFEYRFNLSAENIIEKLFSAGVKNIIIPYIAVPQNQSDLFTTFFLYLKKKLSIGESLHLAVGGRYSRKEGAYYRLYGNPLNKFF